MSILQRDISIIHQYLPAISDEEVLFVSFNYCHGKTLEFRGRAANRCDVKDIAGASVLGQSRENKNIPTVIIFMKMSY